MNEYVAVSASNLLSPLKRLLRRNKPLQYNFINREQCRARGERGSIRDFIDDMFTSRPFDTEAFIL